jgi:subtilisin family serine protease
MFHPYSISPTMGWRLLQPCLWLLVLSALATPQSLSAAAACAPNHLLIRFKPEAFQQRTATTKEAQLSGLKARLGLPAGAELTETPLARLDHAKPGLNRPGNRPSLDLHPFFYLRLPPGLTPAECARQLEHHPLVDYAEPDWIGTGAETVPDDPGFGAQWHHINPQLLSASIQTPLAWDITQGSSNVLVAVLDTGLADLPEFIGRTVPGYNFVSTNSDTLDDNGHGTQVTSLLAANASNGILGCGVDWHCRIMPIKVFDANNQGLYSSWAQAIDYAVSNGCKVINLSGGGTEFGRTVQRAITNAIARGVIFVTAAGNGGATNLTFPGYLREPITVGATDEQDQRASFSNSGPQLDLVAPGFNVVTMGLTGEQEWVRGTSFSAPLVSGVCALLAALRPDLTQADARLLLCAGADDEVGGPTDKPGFDTFHGWGRLNAFNALLLATTKIDSLRHTPRTLELGWRGPINAVHKRPYQVEFQSAVKSPWMVLTQLNTFRHEANRILWEEELPEDHTVGGTGFYRVTVRPLP